MSGLSQAYGRARKSSRNQLAKPHRPESLRTTTTACPTKSLSNKNRLIKSVQVRRNPVHPRLQEAQMPAGTTDFQESHLPWVTDPLQNISHRLNPTPENQHKSKGRIDKSTGPTPHQHLPLTDSIQLTGSTTTNSPDPPSRRLRTCKVPWPRNAWIPEVTGPPAR